MHTLRLQWLPSNSENKPRGLYFSKAPFRGAYLWKEICVLKSIGLASLKVGSKFTVVALFYFVFLGQLSKYKPPGGLYLEGQFNGGFFGLPVWGAYIWRGLFLEFYGIPCISYLFHPFICLFCWLSIQMISLCVILIKHCQHKQNKQQLSLYLYWQKIKELTKTYSRILTKIEHSPLNQQCSNNVSQTHPWVLKVSIE